MSRILIALLVTAGIAHAECYTRGTTVSKLRAPIERVTDVQNSILPADNGQFRCRVTFRALIQNLSLIHI